MMNKPVTYYVMHYVDGDECVTDYVTDYQWALVLASRRKVADPRALISIWSNAGVMLVADVKETQS